MKNFRLHIALISLALLSGCGSAKLVTGSQQANPGFSLKDIIKTHNAAAPEFTTLAARVNVDYEDPKSSQNITVSLRMEKDKTIWVKASLLGITLSKALITPTRVQYYERITNTYFDGDFTLISNWLGTEIDFDKAQNILLGQSIYSLDQAYDKEVADNQYKLSSSRSIPLFAHVLALSPEFFKIASQGVDQGAEGRSLRMYYPDYQEVDGLLWQNKAIYLLIIRR